MKTRAAVLRELGKPLAIEELEIPPLKAGQVLVKVLYSGVCHSQLNEVRGRRGPDAFLPHTLGHEGTGEICEVGEGVTRVKTGDHVLLSWLKGDGADVPSTKYAGRETVNSGAISTFMQYAVLSENRVTKIDDDLPMAEMALLGCAVPTGAGIVLNKIPVGAGSSVAIIGVGGIGTSVILAAKNVGANPIAAIDVVPEKLAHARALGATHAFDASESDWRDKTKAAAPNGFDFVIEAAGRIQTIEAAMDIARAFGGVVVMAGNPPAGERVAIDPYDLIRGKVLMGTWGGETQIARDTARYISWYRAGQLPLAQLISKTYSLDDVNQALDDLEAGLVLRALLKIA